ncbi:uL22 family ribosomal protein [Candidatus Vidania fulgoroideorum]
MKFLKFSLKKVNISLKKIKRKISYFKKKTIQEIINETSIFYDKSDFILNKFLKSVYFDVNIKLNKFNFKKFELFANKSKTLKKIIFRAKGKTNIIKKRFCNLFMILYI